MPITDNTKPSISILMSAFNEAKYIKASIESILHQSFTDFEFIITDDDSNDGTLDILKKYASKDSRIKIIEHFKQKGLAFSLNEQIETSKGKYLARMDGDDIAHPDRLKKQLQFLEKNDDIGMVGSFCREISNNGKFIALWKRPTSDHLIKKSIFHFNPFIHSSIMIRRDVIIDAGMYNTECKYAQDYDLWLRVAKKSKLANLNEPLIDLRVDWDKLKSKNKEARKNKLKILFRHIKSGGYPFWYFIYLIRPCFLYVLPTNVTMLLKLFQRNIRMSQISNENNTYF